MDTIDAIIVRHESSCKTNALNATRNEATATNSVLKSQGGLAGKHDKSVVRAL
jgi:hypothetical protein